MDLTRLRAAVVGHVEWVTFLPVDRVPAPGVIAHADESWDEAAGGGGVAAVEMARLCGRAALFTALGEDAAGHAARAQLEGPGVQVHAAGVAVQRRAVTLLDPHGERTIVVIGPAAGPSAERGPSLDALAGADAVYFCKGDAAALRMARRARVLVATARVLPVLQEAGVELDALVHSARDPGERYQPGDLMPAPRLVATTEGAAGGAWTRKADGATGRWAAAMLPGPVRDTYGAGDCFAAALTLALAAGQCAQEACEFAATRGAAAVVRRGAHGLGASRLDAAPGPAVAPFTARR